jgi:acetyl-CoA acetyltransferase
MGVGPAVAIPAAVKAAGLELDDIDLFEINEVLNVKEILILDPGTVNM